MFKKFVKLTSYVLLFFLVACTSKEFTDDPLSLFKDTPIVLKPTVIDTDQPVLLGGYVGMIKDSVLAVYSPREDTLLILVDIHRGKVLKRIFSRGQGPEEMTELRFCPQANKDQVWIHDPNQAKVFRLDMEVIAAIANGTYRFEPTVRLRCANLLKTGNYFVGSGSGIADYRFRIFDSKGDSIMSCLHYQKPDIYSNIPDHVYANAFQGVYTVHPDNKKIAFSTNMSGSIQFFDFTPEALSLRRDLFFYDPSFKINNGICIMNRDAKMGFPIIDSDKDYVYTLYAGDKTLWETVSSLGAKHILVFDWNGKPIKRYELEKPVYSFCLNSTGDKIYGIAFDPESIIVKYNLK